jgi:hypothetical protein
MNKTGIKKLIQKLYEADICCLECACTYGHPTAGDSSMWEGRCHVCGKASVVTETRDYGYLAAGMRRLSVELNAPKQK